MSSELKKQADEMLKKAYSEHYSSIYKFCLSRLPKDRASAEDCTQEAFLVLYKKYLAGEEVDFVKAFLYQTARNFVLKQLENVGKREKEYDLDDIKDYPASSVDVDDRLAFDEYTRQISAALSDKEAEIFSMRYVQELDIEEIALRLNMSVSNTYTSLSRIREKLRRIFGKEHFIS